MNKNIHLTRVLTLFSLCLALMLTSCRDSKYVSYVEMVKRDAKEVAAFMNENNIEVIGKEFPEGLVTPERQYVKILDEGVYMRVIKAGGEKAVSGETKVSCRFILKNISTRTSFTQFDNLSSNSGGTFPLRIIYSSTKDNLLTDPRASVDEANLSTLHCAAINEALKYVGDGSVVQIITNFENAPSFAAQDGLPMFFEELHFNFVKN